MADRNLQTAEIYASHEALVLDYERAMLSCPTVKTVNHRLQPVRTPCGSASGPDKSMARTSRLPGDYVGRVKLG